MVKTTTELKQTIDRYVSALQAKVAITAIFLTGDYACGAASDHSDISLVVISPSFKDVPEPARIATLARVGSKIDPLIQAWGFEPSEVDALRDANAAGNPLLGMLLHTSRQVYPRAGDEPTRAHARAEDKPHFGRLLTAMITPFSPSGEVDYGLAQRLALSLLDSGSDGVVVAGTTGEAPTLAHEEKIALFGAVKEAVGDRGAVLAGTGTYSTAESIVLSRAAAAVGVDGLLLTVPYYNKPPQEGLYRHFQAIAASTPLPCVLYNIPGRTSVDMLPGTTIRLAAIPNIVGVKEASGHLDAVAKIAAETGPDFRIWSGDDQLTLPILASGGYGVICVTSHLVGRQIRTMIEDYVAGRVEEAAAAHQRLLPLMVALMTVAANPMPVKHALNKVGFPAGGVRLPLWDLDEAASARLMAEVSKHKLDLPVAV